MDDNIKVYLKETMSEAVSVNGCVRSNKPSGFNTGSKYLGQLS